MRKSRPQCLCRDFYAIRRVRAAESPDGKRIAFCRARTGEVPGLYTMDARGREPRLISRGIDGKGADHPRWLARRS